LALRQEIGRRSKGEGPLREEIMRTYILAAATAALFILPTAAFSQVEVGPGGVRIGPGPYHRYYNRYEGRCHELRQACLHKEELGEQGLGNCRRYRAICG
jgi:hypothetical protein